MGKPRRTSPTAAAGAVLLSGIAVTALLAWAARTAHADNESRLLEQRTDQGAAVIRAAIPGIEQVLVSTVAVASAAGADGELLSDTLGTQVGPEARFRSAAVWADSAPDPTQVLGDPPSSSPRAVTRSPT